MRTEEEVKKFKDEMASNLVNSDDEKATQLYKGVIRGLDWVLSTDEVKKE